MSPSVLVDRNGLLNVAAGSVLPLNEIIGILGIG